MRLIDADALLNFMEHEDESADWQMAEIVEWVEQQPTIEAKPVVHAHWVNYNDMFPRQCSNCNGFALSFDIGNYQKEIESDFCPHCGAQMDEVVDEEIATTKNNTQKVSVDGVKIPVIGMEDVPKLAKEMEK